MYLVNNFLLFLTSTMLLMPIGCKTTETESGIKDSNFSRADPAKDSIVLWLASDGMVHYGACPVGSTVVDRNCPNMTETETPIKADDYKEKVLERIKLSRPKSKNGPQAPDATVAQALLLKIDRLKAKLAAGGLTPTETTNFQKQLDEMEIHYGNARIDLSPNEQADLDKVMEHLDTKHITYDEGERLFNLALSPFIKGFNSYRLVVTGGPSTCSNTIVIAELNLDFGSGLQPVTVANQTGGAKDSAEVAGQAFELVGSSIYSSSNSVGRAVSPANGTGWAPKAFLSNGAPTSVEYLQMDFPNAVSLKGVAFAPGNSNCQLTAFHMEGSGDATNFTPIPGAEYTGIVYQAAKQTFNW